MHVKFLQNKCLENLIKSRNQNKINNKWLEKNYSQQSEGHINIMSLDTCESDNVDIQSKFDKDMRNTEEVFLLDPDLDDF
jgi:hypothetical protein